MKTIFTKGIMALIIIALVSSCSTSNDVASNRGIQKRKYNKGFFVSKNVKGFDKKTQQKNVKYIELNEEITEVINSQINTKENASEFVSQSTNTELAVSDGNVVLENDSKNNNISDTDNKTESTETIENDNLKTNINKKKTLKKQTKQQPKNKSPGSDVELILLVILAIIIPPLAVFLYEEASTRFWIDLILALLGWGFLAWILPGFVFIGGLAAIIYALLIVTGTI